MPEFGTATDLRWDIPKRTDTKWLYGVLPSSYQAILTKWHLTDNAVTAPLINGDPLP